LINSFILNTAKAQVDRKFEWPMNHVTKISIDDGLGENVGAQPTFITTFNSKDSSVFSIDSGVVHAIAKAGDAIVVIVQGKDYFYAYSNFKNASVKEGDSINSGQLLGYADINPDTSEYVLDLMVTKGQSILQLKKKNFIPRIEKSGQ